MIYTKILNTNTGIFITNKFILETNYLHLKLLNKIKR
jgi:hypothetical protein